MINVRNELKKNLKYFNGLRIKAKARKKEAVRKELFIQCIEKIIEVEDRNEFLIAETGIDVYAYTTIYYEVIHNLFRMIYSDSQIEVIQNFIEKTPKEEATIVISLGKKKQSYPFTTVEDLYNVVETLNNVKVK